MYLFRASQSIKANIVLISGLEAARILNNLTDQKVNMSAIVSLRCEATGRPTPQVVWTRDNKTVVEGSGETRTLLVDHKLMPRAATAAKNGESLAGVILSRSNQTLTIQRVKKEDSGRYTCTACNRQGCDSTQAFLATEGQSLNRCLTPNDLKYYCSQ